LKNPWNSEVQIISIIKSVSHRRKWIGALSRGLDAALSPRSVGFDCRWIHLRSAAVQVALEQFSPFVSSGFPLIINIPLLLYTHLLPSPHRCHTPTKSAHYSTQ
jgi:hypothetical protein